MRDIDLQGTIRMSFDDVQKLITISQRLDDDSVRELFLVRVFTNADHLIDVYFEEVNEPVS